MKKRKKGAQWPGQDCSEILRVKEKNFKNSGRRENRINFSYNEVVISSVLSDPFVFAARSRDCREGAGFPWQTTAPGRAKTQLCVVQNLLSLPQQTVR